MTKVDSIPVLARDRKLTVSQIRIHDLSEYPLLKQVSPPQPEEFIAAVGSELSGKAFGEAESFHPDD